MFMDYRLTELVGTDERYTYRLWPGQDMEYVDSDTIRHLFGTEFYHRAMEAGMDGKIDLDTDEYHFIVQKFAERYGFGYERKEQG